MALSYTDYADMAARLAPFLAPLLQVSTLTSDEEDTTSSGGGGGSGGAPSPHDLFGTHHTGELDPTQATWAFMLDGSRPMTGNIIMASGATVDGVDVSALASDVSTLQTAHSALSALYTAHDAADAVTAHGSVGAHDHLTSGAGGQLDHGAALTGLADDDHTQYLHLTTARTIAAVHTFNPGSATAPFILHSNAQGQTVTGLKADQLSKSVLAGDGLSGGGALTADRTLAVDSTVVRTTRTITAGAGLTGGGDLSANRTMDVGAGTGISVAADSVAVDQSFTPTWTGSHIFAATMTTRTLVAQATDAYDIGSATVRYRKGYLSELDAVLFAKETKTLVGGWLHVGTGEGDLAADVGTGDTDVDFGQSMTSGQFVEIRAAGQVEYLLVGSVVSGTRYGVTRNLDGSGANAWPAGTPYAVLQNGKGYLELNAYDTPRISGWKHGASYNARTEQWRLGDLNGYSAEYSAETTGAALGPASGSWLSADETLGLRVNRTTVTKLRVKTDGTLLVGTDISAAATTNLAVFTGNQTYNGESVEDGDLLLGDNSSGKANVLWDKSTGRLNFRGGTTVAAYVDTSGAIKAGSGDVTIDSGGISIATAASGATPNTLSWVSGGQAVAKLYTTNVVSGSTTFQMYTETTSIGPSVSANIRLSALGLQPATLIISAPSLSNATITAQINAQDKLTVKGTHTHILSAGLLVGGDLTATDVPGAGTIIAKGALNLGTATGATWNGSIDATQAAQSSGTPFLARFTGGAHTALTASAEIVDFDVAMNRTVQRATGAVTTQRAALFRAPTYSFVGASVITDAATLAITDAPAAGTNATITRPWALWVQAGATKLAGGLNLGSSTGAGTGELIASSHGTFAGGLNVGSASGAATGELKTSSHGFIAGALNLGGGAVATWAGALDATQAAQSGGTPFMARFTGGAHTNLTAGAEVLDLDFAMNRTMQRATGAVTMQRAAFFRAPTYSFVGASVITDAATLAIERAPQAGTNATITNAHALLVQAGQTTLQGGLNVGTALGASGGNLRYSGSPYPLRNSVYYQGYLFVSAVDLNAGPYVSTTWDGDAKSDVLSSTALNLVSVFGIPSGLNPKAVLARVSCRDSAAWGSGSYNVQLGPSSTNFNQLVCRCFGSDVRNDEQGLVEVDGSGQIWYRLSASGAGTLDVWIEIWGFFL